MCERREVPGKRQKRHFRKNDFLRAAFANSTLVSLDEKSHEYTPFLHILVQAGETARKGHGAPIRYFVQHSQAWNPGSGAVAYLVAATAASVRDRVFPFSCFTFAAD